MPSLKSQQILSRIKQEHLRKSAEACFDLAEEFAARRAELDKSGNYTARGRSKALSDVLSKEFAPRLRKIQQPVVQAVQELQQRRSALAIPAPDANNIPAALDRQEIRTYLRGLPLAERTRLLFDTKDQRIIEAVLSAPQILSGMPDDLFQLLANQVRETLHGPAMEELADMEAEVEEARMAIAVATADIKIASGLDDGAFDSINGNVRQGAPWLKQQGDHVVVIVPGESTAPLATAEQIATGKFYATHDEYLRDRAA